MTDPTAPDAAPPEALAVGSDSLGQRIRARRDTLGITQEQLAVACGVSRAAVAQWESGVTRPSLNNLMKAAATLGVWLSWLSTGDPSVPDTPNPFAKAVAPGTVAPPGLPVIDLARAALWPTPGAAKPEEPEWLAPDANYSASAFALVIRDESMAPDFRDGDKIIVDPEVAPQPGDFVVAKLKRDSEAIFRKFRERGADADSAGMIELVPLNPDWPTLAINAETPGRIVGTLVEHRRYRRRPA